MSCQRKWCPIPKDEENSIADLRTLPPFFFFKLSFYYVCIGTSSYYIPLYETITYYDKNWNENKSDNFQNIS